MTTITLTNLSTLSDKDFDLLSKYLSKKGIEFTINDTAPEKTTKAKSAPKSKAKSAKAEDDFDRVTYQKVASVMGCLGKHGVWKSCRQWVYAVMDGSMDIDTACKKVADLKASKGWA